MPKVNIGFLDNVSYQDIRSISIDNRIIVHAANILSYSGASGVNSFAISAEIDGIFSHNARTDAKIDQIAKYYIDLRRDNILEFRQRAAGLIWEAIRVLVCYAEKYNTDSMEVVDFVNFLELSFKGKQERISSELYQNKSGREEKIITEKNNLIMHTSKSLFSSRNIFIVHGHDIAMKESVARFIEKIGFNPVILHENANKGMTIIEKFEKYSDVGFSVVTLSPDDLDSNGMGRARQNVILELGYFIGKLGRSRVCALKKGILELPSDIFGIVWTEFDSAGAWQRELAREIKASGYDIDWNAIMK